MSFAPPLKTAPSERVTADQKLSLSLESTVKLRVMVDHYRSNVPHIPERSRGATAEFRATIDAAVDPLLTLCGREAISNEEAFAAFNKLRGVLHGCQVKASNGRSEDERLAAEIKQTYRKHAQELADAGLAAFSVPTRRPSSAAHFQLSRDITQKAFEARNDPREGASAYARFFISKLDDAKTPWNSVSFVTALFKLAELDSGWARRAFAPQLCELAIQRLHTVANKEIFDGRSIANLARIAPGLIDAVGRLEPRSPQLEKMLFNSLSRAIEYLEDKPDEKYADSSFLFPMREISSRFLTDEGAEALCTYVAKLNHLFSQMSYRNVLPTIAATFHAINGISSWGLTQDSDAKLTLMLRNLNDRLGKNTGCMDSVAAGSIIYGLKGIDLPHLSSTAQREVCRTLKLVAEGIDRMPPRTCLNHAAVSSIVHGLTVALSIQEGPVSTATRELLGAVERRIPYETNRVDQLGAIAGALVTLRPHAHEYPTLCKGILRAIELPCRGEVTFARGNQKDCIAWQTLQQAYSLYDSPMPDKLRAFVSGFKSYVEGLRRPNLSEQRISAFLKDYPGLQLLDISYVNGFEVDLMVRKGRTIVNIEVDGNYHNEPAKRISDAQRDVFLRYKMKGIEFEIVRIPSNCSKSELFAKLDLLFG